MGIFLVRRSVGETTGFGCRLPLELDFVGSLGALLQGALAADLHIWVILDPTSGCLLLKLPFHLHRLCLMSISIGHMLVSISLIIQIFFLNPNSCEWLIGLNYSHVFNQLFLDFTTIVLQQSPIFSFFFLGSTWPQKLWLLSCSSSSRTLRRSVDAVTELYLGPGQHGGYSTTYFMERCM